VKTLIVATVAAVAFVASPALAKNTMAMKQPMAMNHSMGMRVAAPGFVKMAASSDMFEINSSKLARKMARNPDVQQFAVQMIADHSKSSMELMATAKSEGIPVPAGMMAKHAVMLSRVAASGADFDSKYVEAQVMAHNEAVALFSTYARTGDDPALRAFAAQTLPILEQHRRMIMMIRSQMVS